MGVAANEWQGACFSAAFFFCGFLKQVLPPQTHAALPPLKFLFSFFTFFPFCNAGLPPLKTCAQVDRLYSWKSVQDASIRDSFKRQKDHVMTEFEQRSSQVFLQLNELVRVRFSAPTWWKNNY